MTLRRVHGIDRYDMAVLRVFKTLKRWKKRWSQRESVRRRNARFSVTAGARPWRGQWQLPFLADAETGNAMHSPEPKVSPLSATAVAAWARCRLSCTVNVA